MIPGLSTVKLIGGLVALLILVGLIADRGRWMHRAHNDEAQLATICASVRAAADNPKLDCKKVPQQIAALGDSLKATTAALNDQNAKVAALGQQTVEQQAQSSAALKTAMGRARKAQATSERLAISSRSTPPQNAPQGQFSKAFEDAWQ